MWIVASYRFIMGVLMSMSIRSTASGAMDRLELAWAPPEAIVIVTIVCFPRDKSVVLSLYWQKG
jgi:hypothetical protein